MREQDLDSSKNPYLKEKETSNYIKQVNWEMAIGLQKVDNLNPSLYLINLSDEYIKGDLTIEEVEESLKNYYIEHEQEKQINKHEKECDFVSLRIVELLNKDNFELSVDYLKYIHKYLFQDIYDFAGHFRNFDFSKHEEILNNDSVAYGSFKSLQASLEYDISLEKKKNYKDMSIIDVINNIVDFSSSIWQVHPFEEGNTRTTAVFIEKYLINLGYNVDNSLFKDKSIYFRNALVRSNYFNNELGIKENKCYLIKFYENLLLGKNNNLQSKNMIVKELFNRNN